MELFWNLTCGFRREEFWRISLKSTQFRIQILKRVTQETILWNIPNSDQRFQRRRFFKNFFMSIKCKMLPFTKAMLIYGSNFHEQFLKRVTKGKFLWNYFKIGPGISEKKIFYEFLHVHLKSPPPPPPHHGGHVFWRIKISQTAFEKGHTRNNSGKLF